MATEKHPIEIWDQLVRVTLYPKNLNNALPDIGIIEAIQKESGRARELLHNYLLREVLSCKSKEEISVIVEINQALCTDLLDAVYEYQNLDEIPFEFRELYGQVLADLESVLLFLKANFNAYFNKKSKVPKPVLANFEKGLRSQLIRIKERLVELERNQQLSESVFKIIESYIQPSGDGLSYMQVDYLESLIGVLYEWDSGMFADSKLSPLIELLIAWKFNDEGFLRLVFQTLKDRLSSIESEEEKIKFLKEVYKYISQIPEHPFGSFVLENNSAKEIILDWLSQEIDYLEACLPKKEVNASNVSTAKINTSLSVPVLALYLRLFKEAGIITNSNYQQLFRAVSSTFTTNRKADVAHSHLHSKFYAIEEGAKRKVFDQLMEMAHLCKRIA